MSPHTPAFKNIFMPGVQKHVWNTNSTDFSVPILLWLTQAAKYKKKTKHFLLQIFQIEKKSLLSIKKKNLQHFEINPYVEKKCQIKLKREKYRIIQTRCMLIFGDESINYELPEWKTIVK